MSFFNRSKKNNVQTLSKEALTEDKNKDGIPDYLQRENYASIVNSNKDFLKWESDVEQEIEQYIYGLKGYAFDVKDSVWTPVSPPIMNQAGISFITTMIRTVVNKHSINTYLKSDEVHEICLYHTTAVVKTLKYRKNIYSINLADLDSIVMGFDNLIYIIMSRSVDDRQRQHNDNRLNMNYSGSDTSSKL